MGASVSLPLVFFLLREFFSERLEQAIVQANSNSGQGLDCSQSPIFS